MREKMSENPIDMIRSTDRMFITCNECGKESGWVVEFASNAEDFWYQPKMTCNQCYYKDVHLNDSSDKD